MCRRTPSVFSLPIRPDLETLDRNSVRRSWYATGRVFWFAVFVIGALLRGIAIDHTPALTDEAFTSWRTCGTFGQMLDALRDDAFVPLHYQIVWCLTRALGQGIWVLRLPAAIAGVVMPFAVGRLARVLFGRRAMRPATLLALVSPYFALFARNAKMYMPAWLMLALALGSILVFARTRRRLPLLTFTCFGVAAGGLHSIVLLPLAFAPLLALVWARRRRWAATLVATLATAIVFVAPAIYYVAFNRWFTLAGGLSRTVDGKPAPHDNGLGWIDMWQLFRTPANVLLECLTSFLVNVEWPSVSPTRLPHTSTLAGKVLALTIATLGFGALLSIASLIALLVRRASSDRGRRSVLVVVLIALPLYLFYLRSFRSLAAPWQVESSAWIVVAIVFAMLARRRSTDRRSLPRRIVDALGWLSVSAAVLTLAWAGAKIAYARSPLDGYGQPTWNSLWMPRYAAIVAAPLLATLGGAVATLPTRTLRAITLALFCVSGIAMTLLSQVRATQPPTPTYCRDLVSATRDAGTRVARDGADATFLFPSLPGPYYDLVRAAEFDVDPLTFRVGNQWPYRPGPAVAALKRRLTALPATKAAFADPAATRVIIWSTRHEPTASAAWAVERADHLEWFTVTEWEQWNECWRVVYRRRAD